MNPGSALEADAAMATHGAGGRKREDRGVMLEEEQAVLGHEEQGKVSH